MNGSSVVKLWVTFTKECFVPSLVDIGPVNLENLCYYLLGKGCGSSFEQTWIPLTKGCFEPSLVEIRMLWSSQVWLKLGCFEPSLVEIGQLVLAGDF